MNIKDVLEGINVIGKDIFGEDMKGKVAETLPTLRMVLVRTGNDRLELTTCEVKDIERIED